ncbi:hypothetical protein GUITHDRAFT_149187 [Guillardia theta CCMP2712]|uniref:Uncharacterized protein n=2 Tax=Guillardia theta TaxID=55529 RepID=L1I6W8_GUITC|nr:hypothetical protein GUITHDRAFT_149187 [Guillardia theta CCMP2712]EKX31629.1 hypothetical protein GUITHDRAFT_149187 [Guillardia theta CCMP2712]|eukprot:XP_005818609.1 hypothetical protein GUITHDRAFT_149187 [Guillardia theta CCMP2712]
MGSVLVCMQPIQSKSSEVDKASDLVEELFKSISEVMGRMKELAQSQGAGEVAHRKTTDEGVEDEAEHAVMNERVPGSEGTRRERKELDTVEALQDKLAEVTQRERERVEDLQKQVDTLRKELSDSRKEKQADGVSLTSSQSQVMQLRAALSCAEDDIAALRDALDSELEHSNRLQMKLLELETKTKRTRIVRERPSTWNAGKTHVNSLSHSLSSSSSLRTASTASERTAPSPIGERRTEEEGDRRRRTFQPVDELRPLKPQRPTSAPIRSQQQLSSSLGRISEKPPALINMTSSSSSSLRPFLHSQLDPTSLDFLRTQVVMGYVSPSTPLHVRLEFCGKSSFSLRHKEETYLRLADKLSETLSSRFPGRPITLLKNVEMEGLTVESRREPRLGSFEIDLLWLDKNKQVRRTQLHSKLESRTFPKIERIIDYLGHVLEDPIRQDELI